MNDQVIIHRAAAVRDAAGLDARPGAVATLNGQVLAAGESADVLRRFSADEAAVIDLPDRLILPAFVNAHAHLDLSGLGPTPYGGDFIAWIESVISRRPRTDEAITAAVQRGLALCRQAGVGWLGDIAGSDAAAKAWIADADTPSVAGVSFLECFGFDDPPGNAADPVDDPVFKRKSALVRERDKHAVNPAIRIGYQPHAPYSAGPALYRRIYQGFCESPATHLAETLAEDEFVRKATGPFAELLKRLGKWHPSIKPTGLSPVQYLVQHLGLTQCLVAHCNYVDDTDIALLAGAGMHVAYCPVAGEYFGHKNHRYRDMLAAGINVCLGTDSAMCQPPDEPQPLGILPQARLLHRRDGADPAALLKMATINGMKALSLKTIDATFKPGSWSRLITVRIDPDDATDPWTQALRGTAPVDGPATSAA